MALALTDTLWTMTVALITYLPPGLAVLIIGEKVAPRSLPLLVRYCVLIGCATAMATVWVKNGAPVAVRVASAVSKWALT
ncbi:MAG: hypothetical protein JSS20_07215 [Proteobacteria bacterium]|nr:hypothetical protein [Pseudomonadota bacterium]